MMDVDALFETLIDEQLFTGDELRLVTCILGYSVETLNKCIYARYGYQDYEQLEAMEE